MSIFQKDFCSISFDSKIFEILFANRRQHLFMSVCNLYNFGAFSFANPHCTFYMCFFIIYHAFYMKKPIQSSGANRVFRRRISSNISSFITYSCAALFSCKTKSGSVPLSLPPSLIAARGRQSLKNLKYSHMRPICCTFLYKKNGIPPPESMLIYSRADHARIISMPKSSIFFTASAAAPLSVTTFVMLLAGQVVI